ncbi:3'-5' exonuclease [Actinomadura formosensis]|uniref:3'-5' exonuclease n=1 Tax=Actinomadura formosensis TaxID=60706 RepID=UPI000836C0B9|nr:3'-5' exonuclease [Actinomadura formosensis]
MTDWTELTYAVVDVEGNGQQPPDLVELAIVPIIGGSVGECVQWLLKPDEPIKHFATRIHGLRNSDVAEAPKFDHIAPQVREALDGTVLVAQNAHVDAGLLARKLGEAWPHPEVLDTLKLARRLLPGRKSYRLGELATSLNLAEGLPEGLTPHRAVYDALVTARLFTLLAERARTIEALRDIPGMRSADEPPALF